MLGSALQSPSSPPPNNAAGAGGTAGSSEHPPAPPRSHHKRKTEGQNETHVQAITVIPTNSNSGSQGIPSVTPVRLIRHDPYCSTDN